MQWTLNNGDTVEVRPMDELDAFSGAQTLSARLAHEAAAPSTCKAEPQEGFLFGTLCVPGKDARFSDMLRASFFVLPHQLLFFCEEDSLTPLLSPLIESRKTDEMLLEQVLYDLLERIIEDDPAYSHKLEAYISNLEEQILSGKSENLNRRIAPIRKHLLFYSRYYDQLVDLGQELQENENDLFSEGGIQHFRMFTERARRLYDHIQFLRDYSIQLREIYQSQIDIRQNTIMKLLTVVTTICLPLTIIVGWYGMNFVSMPELSWEHGYLYVILLSLVVVGLCIWFFKRKKFF